MWTGETVDQSGCDGVVAYDEHNRDIGVAALAAYADGVLPTAAIAATFLCARSDASRARRSYCPSAQRYSIRTFWSSMKPLSFRPSRNAATS